MNVGEVKLAAEKWLTEFFDEETKSEVRMLLQDKQKLEDAFYKDLEFGTGGMRGIMGVGTNRIGKYTLGKTTQGLSNYLNENVTGEKSVAIAFDVRHNSKKFSEIVAGVFSANGIKVYLFEDFRPTPELSFAVRHLNCSAGIVLTASHNPPEYNGYKVYWNDGAQIVPPHDKGIIEAVNQVDFSEIRFEKNPELIQIIAKEVDHAFYAASLENGAYASSTDQKDLKIVFTPLHGTSVHAVPAVLEKAGYQNISIVKEQAIPSGDFPTVDSPNPEEPAALKMAMEMAEENAAEIVIGTDPDADRLGIAVRDLEGKMTLLSGNQTNILLVDYLLGKWKETGRLNGKQFVGSTIVSSDMLSVICEKYGVDYLLGLTGFKWIGKMIADLEGEKEFVCGGEESFGFMVGDFVRDKDSVTSILAFSEMMTDLKSEQKTAYEKLLELYVEHGLYKEALVSLKKTGKAGAEEIAQMMEDFRNHPPKELAGEKVVKVIDYKSSIEYDVVTGVKTPSKLPSSNVMMYYTEKGSKVAIRPSGTEPKIKFYIGVKTDLNSVEEFSSKETNLEQKINSIKKGLGV